MNLSERTVFQTCAQIYDENFKEIGSGMSNIQLNQNTKDFKLRIVGTNKDKIVLSSIIDPNSGYRNASQPNTHTWTEINKVFHLKFFDFNSSAVFANEIHKFLQLFCQYMNYQPNNQYHYKPHSYNILPFNPNSNPNNNVNFNNSYNNVTNNNNNNNPYNNNFNNNNPSNYSSNNNNYNPNNYNPNNYNPYNNYSNNNSLNNNPNSYNPNHLNNSNPNLNNSNNNINNNLNPSSNQIPPFNPSFDNPQDDLEKLQNIENVEHNLVRSQNLSTNEGKKVNPLKQEYIEKMKTKMNEEIEYKQNKLNEFLREQKLLISQFKQKTQSEVCEIERKYQLLIDKCYLEDEDENLGLEKKNNQDNKDDQDKESTTQCPICFDKKIDTAFVPCGHGLCNEDAKKFQSCPICRTNVSSILKIFV